MKKLKLFLAACAAMVGLSVNAQEDITSTYLTNADLSTIDNGWTYYSDAYKYQTWRIGDDSKSSAVEFYAGWGSLEHTNFKFSQTVTLPAGDYRIAVNAFYREGNAGNGTNADKAWIFAGETKQNVYALNGMSAVSAYDGGGDDMDDAQRAFKAGAFSNAFDFSLAEETEISLGFEGVFSAMRSWCILGPVKLYKYSLEDYLVDYRAKVAEAEALYTSPMNADVLAALKAAVVEESSFSLSSEVTAAIATLTTKIADANNSISVYSSINSAISNYAASAATLDEAGAAAYNASAIQTKYDNGTYETLAEAEVDLAEALLVATKAQTTEGSNWTGVIINPSFESDFSNGWNNTGSFARQGNDSFAKAGTYYAEFWQPNGTKTLTQTLTAMPAGVYRLTAHSKARGVTSAKIFAAGVNTPITVADSDADYSVEFACDANANVEIGFEGVGTGSNNSWICVDNFTLTLVSAGLPDVTAAEGKMNADVAAAQTNAISSYNAGKTVAGYNAAKAAIAAAEASIAAYVPFTTAINKIDAAITAATTATASTDSYDAVKATYTNGSVADADIRTAIINAYNAVIPVIKSQTAASADFTLAIQNQSFEYGDLTGWTVEPSSDTGACETSNATYAATGSDGQYLFNTWWKGNPITQAVTNLPNGQYTLTVSVASDGATIYLIANGEHNEGTETGGTYPSSDTFQEATFTFLVKDGSATIGAVGGADGTAGEHKDYVEGGYWWYKADNFRLVKNRELTEEEMAIVPTGVTLDKNEVTLTATEPSVTLTPTFEPENATNTVTWTSSDVNVATVADGVVTAVSSGTTTITVKSTLDENVSASATVTVSFPETEVAAYTNDGATRYVHHYGDNIIKNGTFQYPNPFQGWKSGANGNCDANNFNIVTEDENKYIQAKQSNGAGDSHSISTGWPIEAGKTYVFGYKVKASKAGTMQYLVTSLTNSIGTETAQLDTENERKAKSVTTSWTDVKYEFTNSDNYAFVQFRARWMADSQSFDDFYLVEKTADDDVIGNVQYALDAIPTSNIGTGAFQYSQNAIDAANALVQGTATVEDVTNAYNAVTTLNAPAEGKLYNIVNITDGFAHKGKALTFKAASDADLSGNTTSMAWEAEPGYYMPQGVKFTAVENVKNGYKLSYTRADGNVVYISTGTLSGLGNNHNQIRPTNDATKALTFEVTSAGDNHWYLKNTETGNNVGSNGDTGFYTAGGANKDMKIQEAVNNEVALNIKAENQYGTIILPFNAEVPEGVTVYCVSETQGATLTLVEKTTMEANTPYIVFAEQGATATLAGLGSAYNDASFTNGLLTGVYTQTDAPVGSYVLQKLNGTVAFYEVAEGKQPKVGANRAYLNDASAEAGIKAFYLGGDADAIKSVFDGLVNGDAYDLGGRKVNKLQKGNVYIVNGKKVVVK